MNMFRLSQSLRQIACSNRQFRPFSKSPNLCNSSNELGRNLHRVNKLERKFLVWTKKYKTVEDIPDMVPAEIVDKARNKMRIRLANIMMVTTLLGCGLMSVLGKRAHQRGESLQKANLAWHQSHKEEDNAE